MTAGVMMAVLSYCLVAGTVLVVVGLRRQSVTDLLFGLLVWLLPFLLFALPGTP